MDIRNILISIAVVVTLVGCQAQPVTLTDAEVARLEARLGPLLEADVEQIRLEVGKILRAQADRVEVSDPDGDGKPGVTAVLVPAAEEAGEVAGETILAQVEKNPTPAGIAIGSVAALFAALKVFSRRKRIAAEHTKPEGGGK